VTVLTRRLIRLHHTLPPIQAPPRELDFSRFSPEQLERWDQLNDRFAAVGLSGLTTDELVEIADLVVIVEKEAEP
jgi:hypothetical protein